MRQHGEGEKVVDDKAYGLTSVLKAFKCSVVEE